MSDTDTDTPNDGSTEWEQITIPKAVFERLNHNRGFQSWGEYLDELRRVRDDPITLKDGEEIAKVVQEEIEVDTIERVEPTIRELYDRLDRQAEQMENVKQELFQANQALEELVQELQD